MDIAERLNRLFDQTAGGTGRPVTLQEIIDRMAARGISTMSLSYLHQLRSGQGQNPRLQHLRALADAFGVPLSYFVDDDNDETETRVSTDLTPQERNVALRVHGLSKDSLASIRSVIELARRSEGLDKLPEPDHLPNPPTKAE